jgi:restriction system protein
MKVRTMSADESLPPGVSSNYVAAELPPMPPRPPAPSGWAPLYNARTGLWHEPESFPYAQLEAQRRSQVAAFLAVNEQRNHVLLDAPSILLQAVVSQLETTADGVLIEAIAPAWLEIMAIIQRDSRAIHDIDWRKWEEIIAAAYDLSGYEVELTPRSGDKGRDVIATSKGRLTVRFYDQVKAYGPQHLVTANDVRAMLGVLSAYPNVSKGIITTTSDFAPGIAQEAGLAAFIPYRLELKPGKVLLPWLVDLASRSPASSGRTE